MLSKKAKLGIRICPADVPADDLMCYVGLFESIVCRVDMHKHGSDERIENSSNHQVAAVVSLIEKKLDTPPSSLSSMSAFSAFPVDSPKISH